MIRGVYRVISLPLALLAALVISVVPRGRARLKERFGFWSLPAGEYIWFHGASVGEVQGLLPIIDGVRRELPEAKILLTSASVTGLDRAVERVDFARLLPFDAPVLLHLALRGITIREFIFGEVEVWPNLLTELNKLDVPIVMVNAHISERTHAWYLKFGQLFRDPLSRLDRVLCSDHSSAGRFVALGVPRERVEYVGNAKYDRLPSISSPQVAEQFKLEVFGYSPKIVLTLGSIRPTEEQWWFEEIRRAIKRLDGPTEFNFAVVVAPRHSERYGYFCDQLRAFGLEFSRRSTGNSSKRQIILLDTMGELEKCYSFSQLAFIGGSLVDEGAHNPLEAANYGCPVALGPSVRNIVDILGELRARDAVLSVNSQPDVRALVDKLLGQDAGELIEIGARSREVALAQRGAVAKIVRCILDTYLARSRPGSVVHIAPSTSLCGTLSYAVLRGLALLYGNVTKVRNALYNHAILPIYRSKLAVLSVGNVTAGGSGKTPLVQHIVAELRELGLKPVILLRGYGGFEHGPHRVSPSDPVARVGDEARAHLEKSGVPVVVARSRAAGARLIESENLGDVIVLDDGMQHRALARDLEIVSIYIGSPQARQEFVRGDLLPLGRFREERAASLNRANAIVLSERGPRSTPAQELAGVLATLPAKAAVFHSWLEPSGVRPVFNLEAAFNQWEVSDCVMLCAIANPGGFESSLREVGFNIKASITMPDHHQYTAQELERIGSQFKSLKVICTDKDAVKIRELALSQQLMARIGYLETRLRIEPATEFRALIASLSRSP